MRILHTSDWHAGRNWKGRDRLPELQDILEHLGDFIERERIDLVLMSGDVYDSSVPSAEAERAVTTFFKRHRHGAGCPSVVIAGNHDSAARLEAWGMLAEFVGVHARGVPRRADAGGVIDVETRSGERACIAAAAVRAAGPARGGADRRAGRDAGQAAVRLADAGDAEPAVGAGSAPTR